MHYDMQGAGDRALVFIHGFGGFGGLWRWQIEHFKTLARVVTVDLPGHGQTPWASEGLAEMAEEIIKILDSEGIPRAHVVASSFGGLVALSLLKNYPGRVVTLSCIGAPPRFTAAEGFPGGLTSLGIRKMAGQLAGDVGAVLDRFVRSFSTAAERGLPRYAQVQELRRGAPLPDRRALFAFLDILESADMRDVLYGALIPLQFITGDQDYICPPAVVDILRQNLPGARFDVFQGAGHGLFVTLPDACNKVLAEFIGL